MNWLSDLLSEAQGNGIPLSSDIVLDGKVHRFRVDSHDSKESGWYVGFKNFAQSTGAEYIVCRYGSFRDMGFYQYETKGSEYTPADRKVIKEQIERAKKLAEEKRQQEQIETAKEVAKAWDNCQDTGIAGYLKLKGLDSLYGARSKLGAFSLDEYDLVIPMRDADGKLWSIQTVQPNKRKMFYPGGKVQGCFHVVTRSGQGLETEPTIYIAEGFATAASVHEALGKPIISALTAANLKRVAGDLRRKYPDKAFVICGDDDRFKETNKGRETAEEAAKACLGSAIFPAFKSDEGEPTDWNDLHQREGLEAVKVQFGTAKPPEKYALYPLGFKGNSYFFTSTHNQQIVEVSAFSETNLLNLMPIEYWEMAYPVKQGRVDWLSAKSSLMAECRARGIFESQRIRGAGVWKDDSRVVINMGDHLIVDGRKMALHAIKSRNFYTLGIRLPELHDSPLSMEECSIVRDAASLFRWKHGNYAYLLAGAMVTTRICGALPIRPHVWVTGEKGTGKTTLFNRFVYPLIGEPLLFLAGNSTEAGIRQEVSANAVPVLFDEFENNGPKSADILQQVLDLMRVSWSDTNAVVLKGSATGVAQSFQVRFAAIVTSIRQISLSDADKSRFATIELAPHSSDLDHWRRLDGLLSQIDMEYGNRLFARTIRMLPVLLQNFKALKKSLNTNYPGQRFSDQYGMLLAGYSILVQDEALTDDDANLLVGLADLKEAKEEARISDQESCLDQLLSKRISLQEIDTHGKTERVDYTFAEAIFAAVSNSVVKSELEGYGIKVDHDTVAIRVTHTELENIVYKGTRWSKSWGPSLVRISGAQRKAVRIAGQVKECIVLPISTL